MKKPSKKYKKRTTVKKETAEQVKEEVEGVIEPDDRLLPQMKMFCELYATDREFFGNGVESYIEAYDVDTSKKGYYKTACVCASKLLSKAKIYNYINKLLEEGGLNNTFVDKQLLFVISQHKELSSKVKAIQEYNKLKQRITEKIDVDDKLTITVKHYQVK